MRKEDLTDDGKEALIDSFFESLHAIIIHYGLWFRETEHQLGLDKASDIDDGIWFQAIESKYGMNAAKRTNDTCWVRFSYVEAKKIAKMLDLPKNGGIGALKKVFTTSS